MNQIFSFYSIFSVLFNIKLYILKLNVKHYVLSFVNIL